MPVDELDASVGDVVVGSLLPDSAVVIVVLGELVGPCDVDVLVDVLSVPAVVVGSVSGPDALSTPPPMNAGSISRQPARPITAATTHARVCE
jgi:hypothetical protein